MSARQFLEWIAFRQGIVMESPKRRRYVCWPDLEWIARWRFAMPQKNGFTKLPYTQHQDVIQLFIIIFYFYSF